MSYWGGPPIMPMGGIPWIPYGACGGPWFPAIGECNCIAGLWICCVGVTCPPAGDGTTYRQQCLFICILFFKYMKLLNKRYHYHYYY